MTWHGASWSRRAALLTALLFVAVSAVTTIRTARNLNTAGLPYLDGGYGLHDFRDVFYYPAVAVLAGHNPWDASTFLATYPVARPFAPYAPTTLLLHLPFGLLPFQVAEWVHYAMNTALVLVLAYVVLSFCRIETTPARVLGLGAVILLSRPAHMTLYIGQCALYITLATYLALHLATKRPALAGLALAVACVKPTFGIPLGMVMLARRDVRALAWGAAVTTALLAAIGAVLVQAAGGVGPLVHSFGDSYARLMQDPSANPASSIIRIDAAAFLDRLAGRAAGGAAESAITLAILAVGIAAVWSVDRARDGDDRLWSTSLGCLTILACMYHQAYDGLLLTLPIVALATGRIAEGSKVARGVALAAMLVPAVNYLATDTVVDALGVGGAWRSGIASLNGAAVLLAFATLAILALRSTVRARVPARPLIGGSTRVVDG